MAGRSLIHIKHTTRLNLIRTLMIEERWNFKVSTQMLLDCLGSINSHLLPTSVA